MSCRHCRWLREHAFCAYLSGMETFWERVSACSQSNCVVHISLLQAILIHLFPHAGHVNHACVEQPYCSLPSRRHELHADCMNCMSCMNGIPKNCKVWPRARSKNLILKKSQGPLKTNIFGNSKKKRYKENSEENIFTPQNERDIFLVLAFS